VLSRSSGWEGDKLAQVGWDWDWDWDGKMRRGGRVGRFGVWFVARGLISLFIVCFFVFLDGFLRIFFAVSARVRHWMILVVRGQS
jgi:hypothetical protein